MTNWVEGKMTNPSTLIQELIVLPECPLPFLQVTGTPGENEHLMKKEIEHMGVELHRYLSSSSYPTIEEDFAEKIILQHRLLRSRKIPKA
ncbi:hypothetical protein AVEN_115277-1 [Araneus ventricosus]|uniref:Uncharacterized protein n=1 Tax=Araneus ventricosus TaxID=182803 RepID=A0A4Y1ZXX4_ARAVE|nr:hypothetical protein AVEN_115277-1 [Araneus ventricosus]